MAIKKKYFVENDEFLRLLEDFKETKVLSNALGQVFLTMTENLLFSKQFINYSDDWKAEMQSDSIFNCCRYAGTFDVNKGSNPFAYFTRLIINAFIMRINKEKKRNIKEEEIRSMAHVEFMQRHGLIDTNQTPLEMEDAEEFNKHFS